MKIKKKDAEGTIFENDRSLKVVLPCQIHETYGRYIYREYLCYQIYEAVARIHLNTRLLQITLTDNSTNKLRSFSVPGFFIEDDDKVARNFDGKVIENTLIHPLQFFDTVATQLDFFQYLIANTDWSTYASHNVSVMLVNGSRLIPVAYDFDLCGVVNVPYATISEELPIKSVTERLYRGYCRTEPLYQNVRQYYIGKEEQIYSVLRKHEQYFEPKEYQILTRFVDEFFTILKNEKRFKLGILQACLAR